MRVIKKILLNTKLFYFSIFLVFGLIFLTHYFIAGQAVYGDGIEYYAWLHSIYFDHDISFKNEALHNYSNLYNNNLPNAVSQGSLALTATGKVGNFHMPGMAILLFPFYVLADFIVLAFNFLGGKFLRNGYSDIYQVITGLGAVFYATLGIWITEKLIKKIFLRVKKATNLILRLSVITVILASPLFYYLAIDVVNSHFATFLITSLFYLCLLFQRQSKLKFGLLGLILGLATLIRIQEAILFVPLFIVLIYEYFNRVNLKSLIIYFFISLLLFSITITPLLIAWRYLYGSVLLQPYFIGFESQKNLNLLGSLIDPINGLFTKTPLMLLLLIAIPLVYKSLKKEFIIFFSFFVIQVWIIAQYGGWVAASYGARMYISSFPLFFLLAGMLFSKIRKNLLIITVVFFITLNVFSIFNFMLFSKQASGGKSGLEEYTKIRIEKILNNFNVHF